MRGMLGAGQLGFVGYWGAGAVYFNLNVVKNKHCRSFPGGPVVGILLPKEETQVQSLVWEDPTRCRQLKSVRHNYRACALEPRSCHWAARAHAAEAQVR